jgi:hypothetical protein
MAYFKVYISIHMECVMVIMQYPTGISTTTESDILQLR